MSYWLLIILIFNPQWELKSIHYLEALKNREQCVEVMMEAAQGQPDYTHLHCFPAKIPLPAYRIPIKGLTLLSPSFHNKVEDLEERSR